MRPCEDAYLSQAARAWLEIAAEPKRRSHPSPPLYSRRLVVYFTHFHVNVRVHYLDDDFSLGPTLFEIGERLFRLIERKYSIDDRPDASRLEKLADLGQLPAVGIREQE